MAKHFTIIIPTYNSAEWVAKNLNSACTQDYEAYDIIYIDDASRDATAAAAKEYIHANPFTKGKFTLIENPFNKGKMENMYHAVRQAVDNTIIIVLDGDDWLAHDGVLKKLNKIYSTGPVWMTNGSYQEDPTNMVVKSGVNESYWDGNIRLKKWEFSHLGTFRKELFCKIKRKDLMNKKLEFWNTTSDQAMMWPMAEMASKEHFFPIHEPLYVYNFQNPLSDHCIKRKDQLDTEKHIRNSKPYQKLESL